MKYVIAAFVVATWTWMISFWSKAEASPDAERAKRYGWISFFGGCGLIISISLLLAYVMRYQ